MKDDFLRSYRKLPRQEFADRLYQRLSGKKPKGPSPARYFLVWALATMLFALGLTYNGSRLPSQRVFYETPPVASESARTSGGLHFPNNRPDQRSIHFSEEDA